MSFKKAIEHDNKLALSFSWYGDCERELQNYDEAIKFYDKAY